MREAVLIFLSFAALGIWQSAPSVTTGDAGELAAAAATWSVPHAPGYPAFVVLGRALGTALPLGDWAHRANLLSALCAAMALAVLGDALRRAGAALPARLGAVLVLGLCPLWREQSAVAEVFAPFLLAAAGLLWIAAAAGERLLQPGPAAALGLVFGLGLGAHQTLVLVLPALLVAGRFAPGRIVPAVGWAALGTIAGFSLHLTIPLRALKDPPLNWGKAVDVPSFVHLLLRRDYGTFSLTVEGSRAFGPEEIWAQMSRFFRFVFHSLGIPGSLIAVLGLSQYKRSGMSLPLAVPLSWFLAAGPAFLLLGRPGFDAQTSGALERFFLLPLLGLVPFLAAGFSVLPRFVPVIAVLALIPGAVASSRRHDYFVYDYGRSILRSLPPNAVLVMDGGDDTFYSLMSLTMGSRLRPDVEPRDRGGVVFPGGYGADFRGLPKESKEARRLEVERRWMKERPLLYSTLNENLVPGTALPPAGLLRRPAGTAGESAALRETLAVRLPERSPRYRDRALAAFVPYQRGVDALARGDAAAGAPWLELAAETAPDALWTLPAVSYSLGVNGYRAVERRDWAAAEALYRAAAAVEPAKAEPLANLGVALERSGRAKEAEAAYREAIAREPRSPRPWASLGGLLWAAARWHESADAFDSAAALGDGGARAWAAKARARAGAR